jgi:hypothetical protein
MTEGIPLEEAPYGEYLKILRKEGYTKEADEFEEEFTKIFHELGYSKEDLFATSLKSVQEIIDIYANEVQRQVSLAMSSAQGFQVSGTVLAGKDMDEDTINRVARLQMKSHEEHKNRMMF